jgi:hypothetical protein
VTTSPSPPDDNANKQKSTEAEEQKENLPDSKFFFPLSPRQAQVNWT